MTTTIVQINFRLRMDAADYRMWTLQNIEKLPGQPRPIWQAWTYNSGTVVFNNASDAVAYVQGQAVSDLRDNPGIADLQIHCKEVVAGAHPMRPESGAGDEAELLVPYFIRG